MTLTYTYRLQANIHDSVTDSTITSELVDSVKAGNITSAFDKVSKIMTTINSKTNNTYVLASLEADQYDIAIKQAE